MEDAGFKATCTPGCNAFFATQRAPQKYLYSKSQLLISYLLLLAVGFVAVLAFGLFEIVLEILPADAPVWALSAARLVFALCLWWGFYWFLYRMLLARLSARWIKQRRAPIPVTLTVDDTGFAWESADGRIALRWPGIERVFTTADSIAFLASSAFAYYLPSEMFSGEQELKRFLAQVLNRLSPEARALSERDRKIAALLL